MSQEFNSKRYTDLDVGLIAQGPDGQLAVLSFRAVARGGIVRLESNTWDGRLYQSMTEAQSALQTLADEQQLQEKNVVSHVVLQADPAKSHFFLMEPWGHQPFATAVKKSALFDNQRPVFVPYPEAP